MTWITRSYKVETAKRKLSDTKSHADIFSVLSNLVSKK